MCLSLVGLYVSFLASSFLAEFFVDLPRSYREPCCITSSALVQYFFLVYLLITAAQSVMTFLDLVVVLGNQDFLKNYALKAGIVSWSECNFLLIKISAIHKQQINKHTFQLLHWPCGTKMVSKNETYISCNVHC